ncbi:MAG TPA: excinuclease ABC subunit UvrA [Bacteroidia bacterium]|jgi:excinuclease ABC subunit A|nr:excinuclease ABC subunit UvrA [Bacteroidia bacterium]
MSSDSPLNKDPKHFIIIKGARQHNLKNVDVAIPRNKFVVITGVSGSGKSSLAFDTLYAEGQRRYVESLSAYARQFLGRLEKPQVDYIKGISPAIAIEQKVISRNPRSTVGTVTEIYDYLKLLFARAGKTYSPVSGKEVKRDTVSDVVDFVASQKGDKQFLILSKLFVPEGRDVNKHLEVLNQQGFARVLLDGEIKKIEELPKKVKNTNLFLIIDRIIIDSLSDKEETASRVADSVQTAFYEGHGECIIYDAITKKQNSFTNRFEADGMEFDQPDVNFFSFNNPIGACKTCEGFGSIIGVDPNLVIPNKNKSVFDNAIACWVGESMSWYKNQLVKAAHKFNFPVHKPVADLTKAQYDLLWKGNEHFEGLTAFFKFLEKETYKIQYRVMLARYRGKTVCPDCNGTRIRKDTQYVKIAGKHISELMLLPVDELYTFFKNLKLNDADTKIAKRLLIEITNRLQYLCDVGLGYLTLNRGANTLSGGESQRINLATSLGSTLVGSVYILDEPSIGLHPRDTERLISVLKMLQAHGNSVIVVEHDEEVMMCADEIIDMGPLAGSLGGEVVFQGNHKQLLNAKKSLTTQYLTGIKQIETPFTRRKWKDFIQIKNANDHNLKNISVKIPLGVFCAVTGVSGSGKSTLIKKVLVPNLQRVLDGATADGDDKISGSVKKVSQIEFIDQNPIGKSSRSNPVTYIKAYDEIRNLYSEQQLSKQKGFKPSFFSFNVEGGRCEHCQGEGEITVEMQFMADVKLLCEDCGGKRFKAETLEVNFNGKNISDILNMTVDDAAEFFGKSDDRICRKIIDKLKLLQDVGLGYVQLGQSSSTLSGGEAQRIKLASFLGAGQSSNNTLFIFDEPTTGLHFHDIEKLLKSLQMLIDKGNSVVVIEHNLDVIKCADWLIDLGPEGGEQGGTVLFEGSPDELPKCKSSYTGKYLKKKFLEEKV